MIEREGMEHGAAAVRAGPLPSGRTARSVAHNPVSPGDGSRLPSVDPCCCLRFSSSSLLKQYGYPGGAFRSSSSRGMPRLAPPDFGNVRNQRQHLTGMFLAADEQVREIDIALVVDQR